MNYYNTLIVIAEDSPTAVSQVPKSKRPKETIAEIEFKLLRDKPSFYTQDEIQFETHKRHKEIPEENSEEEKVRFLAKSRACMRTSALAKRFGWGIYFDENGKIELIPAESKKYQDLQRQEDIKKWKAMKSKK